MINKDSEVADATLEFVTYMYKPDNYRRMVEGCEDVIFAPTMHGQPEYLDNLHWLKPGYDGVSYVTPFDVVGDFVYNFNELGQIVIANFANVLNAGKTVEEAMETAKPKQKHWRHGFNNTAYALEHAQGAPNPCRQESGAPWAH